MRLINKKHLAVRKVASNDETRFVLNGVLVEETKNNGVRTVATNGRALAVIETTGDIEAKDFPVLSELDSVTGIKEKGIVPNETIDKVRKAIPKKVKLPILSNALMKIGEEKVTFATTNLENASIIPSRLIQGDYPNWSQVIPKTEPKAVVNVDPTLLIDLLSVATEAINKGESVRIELNGELNPIKITAGSKGTTFTGVLMPMKA